MNKTTNVVFSAEATEDQSPKISTKLKKPIPTSTVGRGKRIQLTTTSTASKWSDEFIVALRGDSLDFYESWPSPTTIVSDGAYGVLGFEGDTSDHLGIPEWYESHVEAWSRSATPQTTLWFWNSEIGWAAAHPILEKYGWRYVNANIWCPPSASLGQNEMFA